MNKKYTHQIKTNKNKTIFYNKVSTSNIRSLNNRNTNRTSALTRGLSPSSLTTVVQPNRTRPPHPVTSVSGVQQSAQQSTPSVNNTATNAALSLEAGNAEALHAYSAQQ